MVMPSFVYSGFLLLTLIAKVRIFQRHNRKVLNMPRFANKETLTFIRSIVHVDDIDSQYACVMFEEAVEEVIADRTSDLQKQVQDLEKDIADLKKKFTNLKLAFELTHDMSSGSH